MTDAPSLGLTPPLPAAATFLRAVRETQTLRMKAKVGKMRLVEGQANAYVLWDLDVGEGVLGGLCRQGPDAEGGGDGGQAGGRHHFSLGGGEKKSELRSDSV